ncbi:MAG: carbon storage regulator CsrA [Phycisphaerales bacterium]|nr:carbon storage regulator CsrA [Phycisphaerales bacterium]
MLVLSRQRDETIMIGDDIEITIVDIRGDKVRLGITAPATVPVHRKEVYEAIQRENREAAKVKMEDLPNISSAPSSPSTPGIGKAVPSKGIGPRMPFTRPQQASDAKNGGISRPATTAPPHPPSSPPQPSDSGAK